jgi:hypothetical protein
MFFASPKAMWEIDTKRKTWTIYFVYVIRGIAKHLSILNEQMPTPNGVNNLLMFLIEVFENWRFSNDKNQKWTFILCPYVCCYVTIRSFVLRVRPYITFANIGINLQTCKNLREKVQKCFVI